MRFRDRKHAGQQLADRLQPLASEHPVILGLPRGGVPVAAEVARVLDTSLDVLVVRKLGVPWQPELGVGAISEGGVRVLNRDLLAQLRLDSGELESVAAQERTELERRLQRYRGDREPVDVEGETVVVIDDGIATGFTVRAAVEIIRRRGAGKVIVAAPVAPPSAVDDLREVADDVIVLESPQRFMAIGEFYDDFRQTSDEEVAEALNEIRGSDYTAVPSGGAGGASRTEVELDLDTVRLPGMLDVPDGAVGLVIFAHGSGSSRLSPRNLVVAEQLGDRGLGTLLFDLLTEEEARDRNNVFDIDLLASRLSAATDWLREHPQADGLPIGYFGASTGAGAALVAAAEQGEAIRSVVSRGGRPDLAGPRLREVTAPTLLIVGGRDDVVIELNEQAQEQLKTASELAIVPEATHLFEEPGALDEVARLAADWFVRHARG